MSDNQLLDLFLVVAAHAAPDTAMFDDIQKAVIRPLVTRLKAMTIIHKDTPTFGFDLDEGEAALQTLLPGVLSHRSLFTLYSVSFNNAESEISGEKLVAINDICRGQIFDRITTSKMGRHDPIKLLLKYADLS